LDIKARLVVEGFLSGLHASPFKGFSQEFADHRQYMPGDELKSIDWKVFGRSDRFYVKEYQEETNLRAYILLDKSGSMGYGKRISKLEYAKYLGASLAYMLFKQKDNVGIATFDTQIREIIPPSARHTNFMLILKTIADASSGSETDMSRVFYQLAQRIRRRGLVIVLSDLIDEPTSLLKALKSFRHRKHEILVFQILDTDERDFPFQESAIFTDMEDGSEQIVTPGFMRNRYRVRFNEFIEYYRKHLLESHIDHSVLYTNTPYDKALFAYLQKRARLL
jgi:uncharacterized protein (DUF58 family)